MGKQSTKVDGRLRRVFVLEFRASYSRLAYAAMFCGHGKGPIAGHTVTSF